MSASLQRLLASPLGRSDWLLAYWSKGLLMSERARREWVEPDLAPFAFPDYRDRPAREA